MNLILVEPEEIGADGVIDLRGRRAQHLRTVLGVIPGGRVRVGAVRGPTGIATVREVSGAGVRLDADRELIDGAAPAVPRVDVILALPRPKVVTRVVQSLASMGVRRIDLVNGWRVDKSYFSTDRIDPVSLHQQLVLGCEQGGTTWVPDIAVHPVLMTFIRDVLPSNINGCAHRLIAHPRSSTYLEQVVSRGASGRITLAIGPEGGWIDRELDTFVDVGFEAVALGPRVLRVEAAAIALLAQLELLQRG